MIRFFSQALAKPISEVVRNTAITVASSSVASTAYSLGSKVVKTAQTTQPIHTEPKNQNLAEHLHRQTNFSA